MSGFKVLFAEGIDDDITEFIEGVPEFIKSTYTHGPHGALIIRSEEDGRELGPCPRVVDTGFVVKRLRAA